MCSVPDCQGKDDLRFAALHLIDARMDLVRTALGIAGTLVAQGREPPPSGELWNVLDARAARLTQAVEVAALAEAARVAKRPDVVHIGDGDDGKMGERLG